jgi:hypothetical protein
MLTVIASEAKQSISPRNGSMDCFVASLLAMTAYEATTLPHQTKTAGKIPAALNSTMRR